MAVSARVSAVAGALLLVGQAAASGASFNGDPYAVDPSIPAMDYHHRTYFHPQPDWTRPWADSAQPAAPLRFASQPVDRWPVAFQPALVPPRGEQPRLSDAAAWVSQIATRHGDRNFLLIDKVHGQLFRFQNGVPVFSAAALTGASLADRM